MKVIKQNPKTVGWKVWVKTNPSDSNDIIDIAFHNWEFDDNYHGQPNKIKDEYKEVAGNFIFEAELLYDDYYKGRSSVSFNFKVINKSFKIETGMNGFDGLFKDILKHPNQITNNKTIKGQFCFKKQGSSVFFHVC